MTRFLLPRQYRDDWAFRLLTMSIMVCLFGLFSAAVIWLVTAEAFGGTFAPLAQTPGTYEWTRETLSRDIPIILSLISVPILTALAIGTHVVQHGGLLGFFASIFNAVPLKFFTTEGGCPALHSNPVYLWAFLAGLVLAFYIGDLGSWLCRRRLLREAVEDEFIEGCLPF